MVDHSVLSVQLKMLPLYTRQRPTQAVAEVDHSVLTVQVKISVSDPHSLYADPEYSGPPCLCLQVKMLPLYDRY
jgi:hypothetical protein